MRKPEELDLESLECLDLDEAREVTYQHRVKVARYEEWLARNGAMADRAKAAKAPRGLSAHSYSGRLLCWRVHSGSWHFVAYGSKGNGFALSSVRRRLLAIGYVDGSGEVTPSGLAWVARHSVDVDLEGWERVPDMARLSKVERASRAGAASWAGMSAEQRSARARKAGLARGKQIKAALARSMPSDTVLSE